MNWRARVLEVMRNFLALFVVTPRYALWMTFVMVLSLWHPYVGLALVALTVLSDSPPAVWLTNRLRAIFRRR